MPTGFDADDLHQFVLQVDADRVFLVEGEALAAAEEQGAFDDDIGAVDKALAFGEKDREKREGGTPFIEVEADLLYGQNLLQVDFDPPFFQWIVRVGIPARLQISVDGRGGGGQVGSSPANDGALRGIDLFAVANRPQTAIFYVQSARGIGPSVANFGRANHHLFGVEDAGFSGQSHTGQEDGTGARNHCNPFF